MKIGMFTANYMDRDLESVFKLMAEYGYEMAELPAFFGNDHCDIEEVIADGGKKLKALAAKYNITISALSNHPEGTADPRPAHQGYRQPVCRAPRKRRSSLGWIA